MAIITKKEKTEFSADRITAQTFLSSINTWYQETGVELGIEKVITKRVNGNFGNQLMCVFRCSILGDMEKGCRARVLNNEGEVEQKPNELGELVDCIEVVDDPDSVTFFTYLPIDDETKTPKVSAFSADYRFIKPLFEIGGETIPDDESIFFDDGDLVETIEGLEFICNMMKNKNGRLKPTASAKEE